MDEIWHAGITEQMGGKAHYGKGVWPNPFVGSIYEYQRRQINKDIIEIISHKIMMLTEPRFITGTETSELMESLITMIGAKMILELGTCTGRSTLHFLRAVLGIENSRVVSIDSRPCIDRTFFQQAEIAKYFQFVEGHTPECLEQLSGFLFDFVFIDSDHSIDHTAKELEALMKLTHPGSILCFHDVPEWQRPDVKEPPGVRVYLQNQILSGRFSGMFLPSPNQLDCEEMWGKDYPKQCNPGLAILIRQ